MGIINFGIEEFFDKLGRNHKQINEYIRNPFTGE